MSDFPATYPAVGASALVYQRHLPQLIAFGAQAFTAGSISAEWGKPPADALNIPSHMDYTDRLDTSGRRVMTGLLAGLRAIRQLQRNSSWFQVSGSNKCR